VRGGLTAPIRLRDANMDRRCLLRLLGAAAAGSLLSAHSPYRQWKLYRQAHLLLFTMRDDPRSDELGELLAAALRERLPDSRARVARAPHAQRIASLVSSRQADVGLLRIEDARTLYRGEGAFADYGAVALRVLVEIESYRLVCRDDFKFEHAYAVAEALSVQPRPAALHVPLSTPEGDVPTHPGAMAFVRGESLS